MNAYTFTLKKKKKIETILSALKKKEKYKLITIFILVRKIVTAGYP